MSAMPMPKGKRPPTFTTYTECEVDIEPRELERAGWVYVGKGEGPSTETVLDTVRRWHDDTHDGPWQWCEHALCDELRGRSAYPETDR